MAPLFVFGVLADRRLPVVASMTVVILDLGLAFLLDVSSENPGSLAPRFVVVYGLGRCTTPVRSIVPLTVLLLTMLVVVALAVIAGDVWGTRDRDERSASTRTAASAPSMTRWPSMLSAANADGWPTSCTM